MDSNNHDQHHHHGQHDAIASAICALTCELRAWREECQQRGQDDHATRADLIEMEKRVIAELGASDGESLRLHALAKKLEGIAPTPPPTT